MAQRKEIKRLEKEDAKLRKELEEEKRERGQEEKERAVLEFERVMMGMEGTNQKRKREIPSESPGEPDSHLPRGSKRKFQLDQDEILANDKVERARARDALDEEKVAGSISKGPNHQVNVHLCRLRSRCFHPSGFLP